MLSRLERRLVSIFTSRAPVAFKHIPLDIIELPRMRPCRADRETAMAILRPDPGCQKTLVHLIGIVGKYRGGDRVAPVPPAGEDRGPSKSIGSNKLPERQLIANSNVVSISHRELHERGGDCRNHDNNSLNQMAFERGESIVRHR